MSTHKRRAHLAKKGYEEKGIHKEPKGKNKLR